MKPDAYSREEFERDQTGQTGADNARRWAVENNFAIGAAKATCRFCSDRATLTCGFMLTGPRMETAADRARSNITRWTRLADPGRLPPWGRITS